MYCMLTALLIEQLTMGTYECMVCCDTIRGQSAVWSCNGCYHIFHLRCIKTWAKSPTAKVEGTCAEWSDYAESMGGFRSFWLKIIP